MRFEDVSCLRFERFKAFTWTRLCVFVSVYRSMPVCESVCVCVSMCVTFLFWHLSDPWVSGLRAHE